MQVREAKGGATVSDTPKTDAACGWPIGQHGRINSSDLIMGADGPFVHSSIARELERELNQRQLSEQLLIDDKGGEREAALLATVEQLKRDNAALRAALRVAVKAYDDELELIHTLYDVSCKARAALRKEVQP